MSDRITFEAADVELSCALAFDEDGELCLTIEFDGESLNAWLNREQAQRLRNTIAAALGGLASVNVAQGGIVHRIDAMAKL